MSNITEQEILQKLCAEIALITRRPIENIRPDAPLGENGIDSMSFLELLIFIKIEWSIDFLSEGLSPSFLKDVNALAERIREVLHS